MTAGAVGTLTNIANFDTHYAESAIYTPSDQGFPNEAVAIRAPAQKKSLLVADLSLRPDE